MKSAKKVKGESFVVSKYKSSFNLIKDAKYYIFSIALVLLFTAFVGYLFPSLFYDEVIKIIEQLVIELQGKSAVELMLYIFFNNLKASFFSMMFGLVFGVFPIVGALFNGYIIGFSSNLAISKSSYLILWRLFPHGIFEIPAIIIAMGVGLYLGGKLMEKKLGVKTYLEKIQVMFMVAIILIPIGAVFFLASSNATAITQSAEISAGDWIFLTFVGLLNLLMIFIFVITVFAFVRDEELRKHFSDALWMFIFVIIPLLVLAAIIEGFLVSFLA